MSRISRLSRILAVIAAWCCATVAMSAREARITVDAAHPGAPIEPTMYGLFFEDINFGADGGLYAEMVKNRSFEFPDALMGWRSFGNVQVRDDGPFPRNPHYVRLGAASHPKKHSGLDNEGFFGVAFEQDSSYRFSVWARCADGGKSQLRIELGDPASDDDTQVCASATIDVAGTEWTKYHAVLSPDRTVPKGRLRVFLASAAGVDIEHVSLFPAHTWKGRDNGLRADIVRLLKAMQPGVFRFPGGCIVEGTDLATRYQWKNTIGPVENRPLNESRWHYTSTKRFYPDYYQTCGLGFYEYFLLAEDLGAEPLPVLNAGMACQYQNKRPEAHAPLDSLAPYIADAIDLVEFANGDTTTRWGAVRAAMGHPEAFGLKYLAIGNEQWGPEYVERLAPFVEALRHACPDIKIIGSAGPAPDGDKFDYLWPEMRRLGVDLVDEHFYRPEEWFLAQTDRYDSYPRTGPKVFAGEYACHTTGLKRNNFGAALCEAAFMTGLERNADVVTMATYAPMLAHVEGWQWRPDMIWFDNLRAVPTASYYVQKLFATHRGTRVLPVSLDTPQGVYATAAQGTAPGTYIVKVVNINDTPLAIDLTVKGKTITTITETVLTAPDPRAENTLDHPDAIVPNTRPATHILAPRSLTIYEITGTH